MSACAFTDNPPIDANVADPEEGCTPMSTSRVKLYECWLDCEPTECAGDHATCVPHLKQLLEEGKVEYENVP